MCVARTISPILRWTTTMTMLPRTAAKRVSITCGVCLIHRVVSITCPVDTSVCFLNQKKPYGGPSPAPSRLRPWRFGDCPDFRSHWGPSFIEYMTYLKAADLCACDGDIIFPWASLCKLMPIYLCKSPLQSTIKIITNASKLRLLKTN